MLDVHIREFSVLQLLGVMRRIGQKQPSALEQQALNQEVQLVCDRIEQAVKAGASTINQQLAYPNEEDLLIEAEQATDFIILELANHFRRYELGNFPAFVGVEYLSRKRNSPLVYKRASGHVTASFAEAMCPWVLKKLGITTGKFLRFRALSGGPFGHVVPDMLVPVASGDAPCEVKHYADGGRIRWDGIATAITQVAAGMDAMQVTEGFIFAAVASALRTGGRYRYRIEVIRLAEV